MQAGALTTEAIAITVVRTHRDLLNGAHVPSSDVQLILTPSLKIIAVSAQVLGASGKGLHGR
jgi:hypothetical protein